MSPHVVYVDKCGCAVMWTEGLVRKFVCYIEVTGK